ncbi:acyl-CoA reductase [Eudoraea chungangensis]|uniref:acyl-CoA reductase n=1 Tax=Eudoraea chungangensis TaxID=1481905 RepID=UPI0023EADBDA|nr:acyl-CoA reductase [Eudoraea chungangensis]
MVKLESRIKAFVKLGDLLRQFFAFKKDSPEFNNINTPEIAALEKAIYLAGQKNTWFTEEQVLYSLNSWGDLLTEAKLKQWLSDYDIESNKAISVALIMAGNIPLVGFHDFLSTLLTGNKAIVKLSSQDTVLLPTIADYLIQVEPELGLQIDFVKDRLLNYDAVIATGSNNTSRYFEHYFGKKPNIIRRNRNSVAILSGKESDSDLALLGEDIFRYYGLGCRNVSKLYVPKGYVFNQFFENIEPYAYLKNQHKYVNNYDYNKAVYLMSEFPFLDNGFFILKEDEAYASPIAVAFYEYYEDFELLVEKLNNQQDQLQCVLSMNSKDKYLPFGSAQLPSLKDYADGIDTVEFLLKTS